MERRLARCPRRLGGRGDLRARVHCRLGWLARSGRRTTDKAGLDTFCGQGLAGVGGDRPVPVKKPSIRPVRYCMRLSRFFTVAARSVAVRTARLARLPFIVDQTF